MKTVCFTKTASKRFWSRIKKTKGCWVWTGKRDKNGYGRLWVKDGNIRAHRFSWTLHFGPVPEGLCVLHDCDNPSCVRPSHLFTGTNVENTKDRSTKGRNACGDRNGARLHPEKLARGDRNGSRLYPERLMRGDKHWSRLYPEKRVTGERHRSAKLTSDNILQIRARYTNGESQTSLAKEFRVSQTAIGHIVNRKTWKHL